MRTILKRSIERVLCRGGLAGLARGYRRAGTLVLAYHNVVPDGGAGGGDRSLHLPQGEFARQLDLLQRTHDVVPLSMLSAPPEGRRPRVVITFDDAYQGAVTAGVEELSRRGLPATIFVTPGFVGGKPFWWDALSRPGSDGLPPELRDRCLTVLRGRDADIRRWAAEHGVAAHGVAPHQTGASEAQLESAFRTGGITLAAHTWSHPNLTALRPEELDEEMVRPLAWLRERFPGVLSWLTYPYGLTSPAVEEAARRAGYEGAFRVEGGWMPRSGAGARPHALPRSNVPAGASLEHFEMRTSGLIPS
ncbi:MAG TPA: polysaccharide deacetylase family protein [Longimicrobiaceae bacterium]|nr:polysaccharide deacetylase family protein [Longimicrobiaceae bacterium]